MPLPRRLLDGYANFRGGRYVSEAERYRRRFFATYRGLKAWHDRVTARLRGGRAPALVSVVVLVGVLPVLLWQGTTAALASAEPVPICRP